MLRHTAPRVIDTSKPSYQPGSITFWKQFTLEEIYKLLFDTVIMKIRSPSVSNTKNMNELLVHVLLRLQDWNHLLKDIELALGKPPISLCCFDRETEMYLRLMAAVNFHLGFHESASRYAAVLGNEYTRIDRVHYNWFRIHFNLMAAKSFIGINAKAAFHHYDQYLHMFQFTSLSVADRGELMDAIDYLYGHQQEGVMKSDLWLVVAKLDMPGILQSEASTSESSLKCAALFNKLMPGFPVGWQREKTRVQVVLDELRGGEVVADWGYAGFSK